MLLSTQPPADASDHRRHSGRSFLTASLRIIESLTGFLLILSLLALSLYVIGTFQEFLPSTQLLLLTLLRSAGGLCAVAAVYYMVLAGIWSARRRHLLLFRLSFGLLATVFGTSTWIFVEFLVVFIGSYP